VSKPSYGIGFYAPAGFTTDPSAIARAVSRLEAGGHRVVVDATVAARWQRFSAPDDERLAAGLAIRGVIGRPGVVRRLPDLHRLGEQRHRSPTSSVVVENLVANSIRYSGAGSTCIVRLTGETGVAVLAVADDGTIELAVVHRGRVFVSVPAGMDVPTFAAGDDGSVHILPARIPPRVADRALRHACAAEREKRRAQSDESAPRAASARSRSLRSTSMCPRAPAPASP